MTDRPPITAARVMADRVQTRAVDAHEVARILRAVADAAERAQAERDALRAERDRLARILAVERGDESAAPEGWTMTRPGRWSHPYTDDAHACVYLLDTGPNQWGWYVSAPDAGRNHSASAPTALEAMEAADAARGGDDD